MGKKSKRVKSWYFMVKRKVAMDALYLVETPTFKQAERIAKSMVRVGDEIVWQGEAHPNGDPHRLPKSAEMRQMFSRLRNSKIVVRSVSNGVKPQPGSQLEAQQKGTSMVPSKAKPTPAKAAPKGWASTAQVTFLPEVFDSSKNEEFLTQVGRPVPKAEGAK